MGFTEIKRIICDKCGYEYSTDSIRKSCPLCAVVHIEPIIQHVTDEEGNKYTIINNNPTEKEIKELVIPNLPYGKDRFIAENYTPTQFNRLKSYFAKDRRAIRILNLSNKELWDIIRGA